MDFQKEPITIRWQSVDEHPRIYDLKVWIRRQKLLSRGRAQAQLLADRVWWAELHQYNQGTCTECGSDISWPCNTWIKGFHVMRHRGYFLTYSELKGSALKRWKRIWIAESYLQKLEHVYAKTVQ